MSTAIIMLFNSAQSLVEAKDCNVASIKSEARFCLLADYSVTNVSLQCQELCSHLLQSRFVG